MIRTLFALLVCGALFAAVSRPSIASAEETKPVAAPQNPVVVFDTSLGKFEVELYASKSPITVKNFVEYVNDKFFDNTIFHRILGKPENSDFMIQGGGFGKDSKEKPTRASIKNESGNGVKNCKYAIAMARTNDLNSATSQFFINVKDNAFLDEHQYCAFGLVTSGTDVIDKIKSVPVKNGPLTPGERATPVEQVVINSARMKAAQ